jgi:DNA-binding transcriptional MerR regulator
MKGTSTRDERPSKVEIVILRSGQAAALIGVCPGTLRNWAIKGTGPPYLLSESGQRSYRLDEVQAWIKERREKQAAG